MLERGREEREGRAGGMGEKGAGVREGDTGQGMDK